MTITGPGIRLDAPIELSAQDDAEWAQIDTGLVRALPDIAPSSLEPEPPVDYLGLRHTLTWQIMTGPAETTPIRQDLYLYADGGPLVYTAPGQPIWDDVTRGGWYRAPEGLRQILADACVPIIGDFEASTVCWEKRWAAKAASAKAQGVAPEAPSGGPWWPEAVAVVGVALVVTSLGTVAARRARRREPVAPIPL